MYTSILKLVYIHNIFVCIFGRLRLKCNSTRAETIFRLSAKRTGPFKSAGASVQSTTGSRGVRISGSNAGYTMLRGRVKGTGYPLHSPVPPSLPRPCVTVFHHVSTGLYHNAQIMDHTNLKIFFYRLMQLLSSKYAAFVFSVILKVYADSLHINP